MWRPAQVLVYPAPRPAPPPLPPGEPAQQRTARRRAASGEFDGVRAYRAATRSSWWCGKRPPSATRLRRTGQPRHPPDQRYELWLDFAPGRGCRTDHELSRLTAWVLQADRLGLDYGLRLPGVEIAPDARRQAQSPQGRRCLERWPPLSPGPAPAPEPPAARRPATPCSRRWP